VTARRPPVRIDVTLPELTPAQADCLWNLLETLAADLWDAYEPELLHAEDQRSRPPEVEDDWTPEDQRSLQNDPSARDLDNAEPDIDF
jgi:hypothetical protein